MNNQPSGIYVIDVGLANAKLVDLMKNSLPDDKKEQVLHIDLSTNPFAIDCTKEM